MQRGRVRALGAVQKKKVDGVVSVSASRISRHAPTLLDFIHALYARAVFVETKYEGRLESMIPLLRMAG